MVLTSLVYTYIETISFVFLEYTWRSLQLCSIGGRVKKIFQVQSVWVSQLKTCSKKPFLKKAMIIIGPYSVCSLEVLALLRFCLYRASGNTSHYFVNWDLKIINICFLYTLKDMFNKTWKREIRYFST